MESIFRRNGRLNTVREFQKLVVAKSFGFFSFESHSRKENVWVLFMVGVLSTFSSVQIHFVVRLWRVCCNFLRSLDRKPRIDDNLLAISSDFRQNQWNIDCRRFSVKKRCFHGSRSQILSLLNDFGASFILPNLKFMWFSPHRWVVQSARSSHWV